MASRRQELTNCLAPALVLSLVFLGGYQSCSLYIKIVSFGRIGNAIDKTVQYLPWILESCRRFQKSDNLAQSKNSFSHCVFNSPPLLHLQTVQHFPKHANGSIRRLREPPCGTLDKRLPSRGAALSSLEVTTRPPASPPKGQPNTSTRWRWGRSRAGGESCRGFCLLQLWANARPLGARARGAAGGS